MRKIPCLTSKTASRVALVFAISCNLLLVYLTHASMVDLKEDYGSVIEFFGDKMLHIIAYAGLSTFYFLYTRLRFPANGKALMITSISLAMFTISDELSQAFVERTVDPFDLICNFAGISLGLIISRLVITASVKLSILDLTR